VSDPQQPPLGASLQLKRVVTVLLVIYLVGFVGSGIAFWMVGGSPEGPDLVGREDFAVNLPFLVAIGGGALVVGGLDGADPRTLLRLHRPGFVDLLVGLLGGAALQGLVVAFEVLVMDKVFGVDVEAAARELVDSYVGSERVWLFILVVLMIPVAEEMFFRGAMLGFMTAQWGPFRAGLVVTLFFAGTHLQPAQLPTLLLLGAALASLAWWRSSTWTSIVAYATIKLVGYFALVGCSATPPTTTQSGRQLINVA
jgi:membrane protease YdiL (CAAX protease family)